MVEQLTSQEQLWIDKLAKVMSSGYGTDRGARPVQVRSGVYRGALLALLPLVEHYMGLQESHPLVESGAAEMNESLTRNRFAPLPNQYNGRL